MVPLDHDYSDMSPSTADGVLGGWGEGARGDGQGSLEEVVGLLCRFLLGVGGACPGGNGPGPTHPETRGRLSLSVKHAEAAFSRSGWMMGEEGAAQL